MGQAAAIGALVGGGIGLIKAQEERQRSRQQAGLEATRTEVAPLLAAGGVSPGLLGQDVQFQSEFDRALQGALGGGAFAQQLGRNSSAAAAPQGNSAPNLFGG